MHTDYHGFLDMPLEVVADYVTVSQGEALAYEQARRGKENVISDAPPGFDLETVEEVIEF